jgi:hypothetical protein
MIINGQHRTRFLIDAETKIIIGNQYFITATPSHPIQTHNPQSTGSTRQQSKMISTPRKGDIPVIRLGWKWFKIASPSDGVGIRLSGFDLDQTYAVERDRLPDLCRVLYERVYQAVSRGKLKDARVRLLSYVKTTLTESDSRDYIVITRDTMHGNRTTIFLRFFEFGDNLYVGLDVYSLGSVNWLKFIFRLVATFLLLPACVFLIPVFILVILWWKIFWRVGYEKNLWLAIRQEHPGKIGHGPFDSDDIIMFSKCAVHLAVGSVREVFEEVGLPVKSLDAFVSNINNISIDNRGSTMINSPITMGSHNRVAHSS